MGNNMMAVAGQAVVVAKEETAKRLTNIARKYDLYVNYIDDGNQYRSACKANDELSKEWDTLLNELGIEASITSYANLGNKTEGKVAELLRRAEKEEGTMNNMTVKQLQAQAKEMGIVGYSKMRKSDLVIAIKAREQAKKDSKVKSDYPMFSDDDTSDIEIEKCLIPVGLAPIPVVEQSAPVEVPVGFVPVGTPTAQVEQAPVQKAQKPAFKARNAAERLNAVLAWLYDQGYQSKKRGYGYTVSSRYLEYIVYSTYGWKSGKWAFENGKLTKEQIDNSAKLIEFLRAKGIIKPAVVTSSKGVKFYGNEYNGMGKNKMTAVKPEHQAAFLEVETARVNTWRIHVEQFREMCNKMLKVIK